MKRTTVFLIALVTLPLAGCLGGSEPSDLETATLDNSTAGGDLDRGLPVEPAENATKPTDMAGGHAPHLHNYWGDKDRVTLFDDEMEVYLFGGDFFGEAIVNKQVVLGGRWWELPEGSTVYEGTGQIDLTVSWSDASITGLSLSYKPANVPWERESFSDPIPIVNGQALSIPVTPAMTDMPHVAYSGWTFRFTAAGTPAVADGIVDLKVDIVRMADIMAFPGHPITYVDTDNYVLADKDFTYKSPSWASEISSFATSAPRPEPLSPDAPVPMKTGALLVDITITSATVAPLAKQNGLDLEYRTAGGNWDWVQPLNSTGDTYTFALPVGDEDVDTPYGETSNWQFYPRIRQSAGVPVFRGFNCGGCVDQELQGHIKVTAYEMDPTGKIAPREDEGDRI